MTRKQVDRLASLEGRHVAVALRDGSRIDDSPLVSTGRNGASGIWLFLNHDDTFVAAEDIVDVWESQSIIG